MIRCWEEMFANLPELSGMMLTAGEFSYCRCDVCTGGEQSSIFDESKSEGINDPRLRTRLGFIEDGRRLTESLGKELIVRGWGMEQWRDLLPPPDLTYATKYAVFDACRGGPDPQALEWGRSGRRTWMMHAIESENNGPIIWHDEDWAKDVAEKLNASDSPETMVHINLHWGHSGHCSGFFLLRNIERVLQHLEPTIRAGDSAEEFEAFFGKAYGRQILDAARLVADVPLEINSILYLEREGFTFNMPPRFDGLWRWPGVIGDPRFDPPSWTNTRGSRTLTQLMEEAASRLLAEGTLLVKQVTDRLGYQNPNDFSRAFRRFFGVPPTDHATKLKRHSEI
jgi:AraC-like DNA-binding protein